MVGGIFVVARDLLCSVDAVGRAVGAIPLVIPDGVIVVVVDDIIT